MLEKNCDNICGFQDLWVTLPFTMFVFVSFSMVARSDVSCFFKIVYVAKSTMTTTTILDWRASIKLRWRQRRRRIKGVNCKQHFLAAPVIHLLIDPLIDSLIDSFIEWFIHSCSWQFRCKKRSFASLRSIDDVRDEVKWKYL